MTVSPSIADIFWAKEYNWLTNLIRLHRDIILWLLGIKRSKRCEPDTVSGSKGGAQERGFASKFRGYAQQVRSRWPRTAAMLNRIADCYEREARHFDEEDAFEEFE